MKLYHVSPDNTIQEFIPRVPEETASDEDITTKRVCLSSSIFGYLQAIIKAGTVPNKMYVYCFDINIPDTAVIAYKKLYFDNRVPDSLLTKECWCLKELLPILVKEISIQGAEFTYYFLIAEKFKDKISRIAQENNFTIPNEDLTAFELMNCWLPSLNHKEQWAILGKLRTETEESKEMDRDSFRQMFHEEYMPETLPDYDEVHVLSHCMIDGLMYYSDYPGHEKIT